MTQKQADPPNHIVRLDVVRAFAILAVYVFHFTGSFKRSQIPWHGIFRDYSIWPREALPLIPITTGWLGVPLFFVVSGFCIHYAFLRRGKPFSAHDFFWRRFLRLYPAYLVAVIGCTCLEHWLPYKYFNIWQVFAHLALVHNIFHETFMGLNAAFWSLGVEAQFYLLYPVLLLMVARWGMQRSLALAIAINLITDLYLSFTGKPLNPVHSTWSFPLVTWCDWILGAALAEAYLARRPLFHWENTWLVASGLLLLAALHLKTLNVQTYLFASVFSVVALQRYLAWKSPLLAIERALIPVGVISYSIYLWHQPMIFFVDDLGVWLSMTTTPIRHVLWDFTLTTLAVAGLAITSYKLFEVRAPQVIRNSFIRRHLAAPPLPGPAADGILEKDI